MSGVPLYPPGRVPLKDLLAPPQQPKFVHLTIYKLTNLSPEAYQALNKSIESMVTDWMKYATESWILYTKETPATFYQKLLKDVPALKPLNILTFYFDNSQTKGGQMQKWIWEWLNKQR